MRDFVGRLTALDPGASETLKVITYFDALVASGVGLDGLLRGAAVLAGVPAGAERRGRTVRFDPNGRRANDDGTRTRRPVRPVGGGSVWLERPDSLRANDEMIVERLALAVELLEARRTPTGVLEQILDTELPPAERASKLAGAGIEPGTRIRLIATDAGTRPPGRLTGEVPSRYGMRQASLQLTDRLPDAGPAGVGIWVRADHAPESWDAAVIAHRLTTPLTPVIDAADLGAMLILARAYAPEDPHPDVQTLDALDDRTAEILRTLVESDSIRAAAAQLAMHHSTLQARHDSLTRELGYDPRSTSGRMRYIAAEMLSRLGTDATP
ncbi:hypothetical protein [Enemella evansiae]|uniref:hypothetical protein n=1 Tax=Enemella evansiae TaxID=2016499 RepID=UPI0011405796|nr:hypothetical protein [Enemella evansiae]